ncbi:MAG: flagellar export protein FliJ [Halomonas sp.]|jgi:flagellar FliJ protein|uniref:Flagellar FliJ protein n=1 Tax=Vreelandella aquamarina TaxID=77097 RepID=A0A6F8SPJ8_9GAMM|nr:MULTISPECIES: flagellar export protein FliJ [Halomonas]KTG27840.1 flagellar export protein FliJ [Idiomarina sp. H105]MEE3268383.1 flagellar export protein FliJ [Pseudomonadota bacterium]OAF06327.1 flagellar export protein FliJ [Idiomarina sp. WRN-38]MCC4291591.1 flagellar export protein FliJ [Halomonas axialensis]MCF2911541.1 flagellar export protein FliJ [Halomonas sp. Cn5-12]|tara:strand:+ start:67 stop:519 length:453 start_codon:yes stop_codon:yes gene_type:complete
MSHNQLDMLTDLARDARDQAGKLLAQERQNQQQTEAQLQSLNRYRVEYAERLQHAMRDGIDPATMYNYQQFLASLDAALVRARQALTAQQKRVQQSQQHWQQEQRKLSSYDTLASRRLLEEHRRQARYEQKAADDFVTSRVARQQSDKPL